MHACTHTYTHAHAHTYIHTHIGTIDEGDAAQAYVLALYFSIGVVTGIGSDDVTPNTVSERITVVSLKLISGALWACGIGAAAGIATNLNPNAIVFQNTMDRLNCNASAARTRLDLTCEHLGS